MSRAVIIGGGAAGMMAAICAARRGVETIIVERNDRLGKKLGITGKGRCNITNACDVEDIFLNIPTNPKFLYSAIYSFTNGDCIRFFEDLGVPTKVERGGRVFPLSDKAADVVNALKSAVEGSGVVVYRARACGIKIKNGAAAAVVTDNGEISCDAALIASGGKSYPQTGSEGDGYAIAHAAGHTITPLAPSLVPLEAHETASLSGLALKNAKLVIKDENDSEIFSDFGEMLFTHFGLSGPIVLSASSHMRSCKRYTAHIDLKSALDEKKLDARLLRDFEKYARRDASNALDDLLPGKLRPFTVKRWGIDAHKKVSQITREERVALAKLLKDMKFEIKGFRPISEAIITSGGVSVSEINAHTMESKLVRGLYFAGEVIDVDAYTGGFNLQIAFSTGHLAGINMCGERS
ncbi:MAG: NAD(P)/FAD-dependent oxidoreductase [Clostridia bacterium]|nr:NAD(P)/FAD-dependent oxidoreductase [Clostridia bacterium]